MDQKHGLPPGSSLQVQDPRLYQVYQVIEETLVKRKMVA